MNTSKLIKSGYRFIYDKNYRFLILASFGAYDKLPDDEYLKRKYKACMGKELDLEEPITFNEKIQWLKLYDRKPEYTMMVDKYAVRQYIADTLGEEYLIPLLGVWNDPEEIDFNALPNQFVLKCNHNSGLGMCICKDKSKLDIKSVKRKLRKGLKQDYYLTGREWPYKNVQRKIIADKYMVEEDGMELKDFKFYCFNSEAKLCLVCSDRFTGKGLHFTFFDRDWNVLPFERGFPSYREGFHRPLNYEKMIELAEKLAYGIPFVRVDFYEINGKIYFGELTLHPGSGFNGFSPKEWDYTLGNWIRLPEKVVEI